MFWKKREKKKEVRKESYEGFFSRLRKLKEAKTGDYSDFFKLTRTFFAKVFKIKYQFTYEELNEEISKKKLRHDIKEKLGWFANKLSLLEYGNAKLSRNELNSLIKELELIAKILITKPEKKMVRPGFFSYPKRILERLKHPIPEPLLEEIRILLNFKRRNVMKMNKLLLRAYDALEQGELHSAIKFYSRIVRFFEHLPEEERRMNYARILKLCYSIEQGAKR